MTQERKKPLQGKVLLNGTVKCVTGLHIGASKDNLDIGGIDAPVLRDPITREPYIPGSSLKGKLRSLFERRWGMEYNRHSGQGVYRHECVNPACQVCRLFGAAGGRDGDNIPARLIVRDSLLTPDSKTRLESIDTGLQYTEWKFENALDRITAAANPRQLERVPADAEFSFQLVYNVEATDQAETHEDLVHVLETLSLLEDDYLGGHGSRGYGKIQFALHDLSGRKVEYYGAETEEKQKQASVFLEVKTVSECKQELVKVLNLFAGNGAGSQGDCIKSRGVTVG
jgi:CRISPR-associated protein Csm3